MRKAKNWLIREFRGWSWLHCVLNFVLMWGLVTMGAALNFTTWHIVSLVCSGSIAFFVGTLLWLRRNEGIREARVGDKTGAIQGVKKHLQKVILFVRNVDAQEKAEAAAKRAIRCVTGYFHESAADELKKIADGIGCRNNWKESLDEIADLLEIKSNSIYASDIKRLPVPGDR